MSDGQNSQISRLHRSVFRWIIFSFLLLSGSLFVIAYKQVAEPWSGTMRQAGFVLIGAILAIVVREWVLGDYFRHSAEELVTDALAPILRRIETTLCGEIHKILPQVKDETVKSIDDIRQRVSEAAGFMISGIGVLSGAKSAGIINIFPTRYEKISGQSVIDAIAEDMDNETAVIKLMGISLGDFFLDRGVLHKKLSALLESTSKSVRIEALLVHPKSEALRERARWEAGAEYYSEPAFFDSTTFIETDGAARIARRLCQQYPNRVEVKLYRQAPTVFLLRTTRSVYIEGYHYAARGSNVPIIQVQAGVPLYKSFDSHFERIWKVAESIADYDPLRAGAAAAK
jgi:hypothetical protein